MFASPGRDRFAIQFARRADAGDGPSYLPPLCNRCITLTLRAMPTDSFA